MDEEIIEKCQCCGNDFPAEGMALESLSWDRCITVWICEECFNRIKAIKRPL